MSDPGIELRVRIMIAARARVMVRVAIRARVRVKDKDRHPVMISWMRLNRATHIGHPAHFPTQSLGLG